MGEILNIGDLFVLQFVQKIILSFPYETILFFAIKLSLIFPMQGASSRLGNNTRECYYPTTGKSSCKKGGEVGSQRCKSIWQKRSSKVLRIYTDILSFVYTKVSRNKASKPWFGRALGQREQWRCPKTSL